MPAQGMSGTVAVGADARTQPAHLVDQLLAGHGLEILVHDLLLSRRLGGWRRDRFSSICVMVGSIGLMYARTQGIKPTEDDLDALYQAIDPARPDLSPLLNRGLDQLTTRLQGGAL
jgi:hypothetical protein